jgi:tetratricopeptide (TPR) repeat protein
MLNLNPELVNQDKIRILKRKRMLKYAILPCLALFLASAFIFRVGVFNAVYSISYGNHNFDIANSMADAQGVGNFVSPYIKFYDGGVAKLRMRDYKEAEANFRASLKEYPPADKLCQIYTNLSLSIELQADEFFNRGDYPSALEFYAKAQSALYSNGCASKTDREGTDTKAKDAKMRLDGKLSKTMNKINSVNDDGGDDTKKPIEEIEITNDQQKNLDRRRDNQNEITWKVRNGYGASGKRCESRDICW